MSNGKSINSCLKLSSKCINIVTVIKIVRILSKMLLLYLHFTCQERVMLSSHNSWEMMINADDDDGKGTEAKR